MSYRDLKAWQAAMDLVQQVYRLTGAFPADERFGLTAQICRAAVSVPSNIVEGQGRRSAGAFAHHVLIARGSLLEVETQLQIALRLNWLDAEEVSTVLARCDELSRMLLALARASDGSVVPDSRLPTPDAALPTPDSRLPTPD